MFCRPLHGIANQDHDPVCSYGKFATNSTVKWTSASNHRCNVVQCNYDNLYSAVRLCSYNIHYRLPLFSMN